MDKKTSVEASTNQSRRTFLATAAMGIGSLATAPNIAARADIVRTDFSTLPPYGNGTIPAGSAHARSQT